MYNLWQINDIQFLLFSNQYQQIFCMNISIRSLVKVYALTFKNIQTKKLSLSISRKTIHVMSFLFYENHVIIIDLITDEKKEIIKKLKTKSQFPAKIAEIKLNGLKFPGVNFSRNQMKLEINSSSKLLGNKGSGRCFWKLSKLDKKKNGCERLANVLLELRDFALQQILETATNEVEQQTSNSFITK